MRKAIFPEQESRLLEFKSIVPEFSVLIKTCVAFANGAGGRIIIGVEDKTRQIVGVKEQDRIRLYDVFPNSLYDAVSPPLLVLIYEQTFENVTVVIIEVSPGVRKPYHIKSEGILKGTLYVLGQVHEERRKKQ